MFKSRAIIFRLIILSIFVGLVIVANQSQLSKQFSLENIQSNLSDLQNFVTGNYWLTFSLYSLAYLLIVALALPFTLIMSLLGGFLFGLIGIIPINIGATLGATLAFLLSRYLIGDWVQTRFADRLTTFNKAFGKDAVSYLLFLRLTPIFPFFLVNLFSGLTKVSLWTFVWTTAVGIIPAGLIFVLAGTGLAEITETGNIISTQNLLILLALGILSLAPSLYKKLWKKKDPEIS